MSGLQAPSDGPANAPGTLIREMDGQIAFWSPAMEERYGYSAEEAVGQISHQLLRTTSWQALTEIEAALADCNSWDGGLIHHRADGRPVMTATHWHLHRAAGDRGALVTELHAGIASASAQEGGELADVMTTLAHELSQPLTAIGGYVVGARRSLRKGWPDRARLGQAMDEVIAQIARAGESLRQLRALGEDLRGAREVAQLRRSYVRLAATFERTERVVREAREVANESMVLVAEAASIREESKKARERRRASGPARRTVAMRNIRLFQHLLQHDARDRPDARTEQALQRLLSDEETKLASLDPGEPAAD